MSKPPDAPQFIVCPNAARPGLVRVEVGTGIGGYSVTPAYARELAAALVDAARRANFPQKVWEATFSSSEDDDGPDF